MVPRFLGAIGDVSAGSREVDALPTAHRFDGGYVGHDSGVSVASRGGIVCMVAGAPRFGDTRAGAEPSRDAEAWLDRYQRQGLSFLEQTKGRFCIAIIRPQERAVDIATDRFAVVPVCYSWTSETFSFSDRADVVAGDSAQISAQALYSYLYFHVIPGPDTVFVGVHRLPPGHVASWSAGRLELTRYWNPQFVERTDRDFAECRAEFVDLVTRSVELEASAGTVGAFLSGGTDSSTIAGMLTRFRRPAKTYSIGFAETGYDEMEYARIAARHFGAEHHEYYVTPSDLLDAIPRIAAHYDQPFGNSSAAPALVCAERARADGVEKMLAGDGGDELFGGNKRYAKQRVFAWYDAVPQPVRSVLLEPLLTSELARSAPALRKAASYVEQARVPMPSRMETYNLLVRLGPDAVFEPQFRKMLDLQGPENAQRATWAESEGGALINRMLAFDWKYTLTDNDLPKVVETTRLAGVDVGFPLLADELVDFSLSLPPEWKLKGVRLRWFFKEALKDFLPPEIIAKEKHGFGLPFGAWVLRDPELGALSRDALRGLADRGVITHAFADRLFREYLPEHSGYYGAMVWTLTMLELWLARHAPAWRA